MRPTPVIVPKKGIPRWEYEAFRALYQGVSQAATGMNAIIRGEVPDGSGDPLPGDVDLSQFFFLPGRADGQLAFGDTDDSGILTFSSTASEVKGSIYLGEAQTSAYDEFTDRLGITVAAPQAKLHVANSTSLSRPNSDGSMPSPWSLYNDFGPPPATFWEALFTDDDNAGFTARNGVGSFGVDVVMSPAIPAGQSSIILRVKQRRLGALSALALGSFVVRDANGVAWSTPTIALNADIDGSAWTEYVYVLTGDPQGGGTVPALANHLEIRYASGSNEANYWAVSYAAVGSATSDLMRWDLNGGTESGRISDDGHMGIGTGSGALSPMLTVTPDTAATVGTLIQGAASQSGNLQEFRNSGATLLSRVTSAGVWDGPISTVSSVSVTDSTFSILDDATPTKIAKFQCSGLSVGTRTFTFPDGNGTLLTDSTPGTIVGVTWIFDGNGSTYTPRIIVGGGGAVNGWGFALDDGSGFVGEIQTDTNLTANRFWAFPDASGTVIISGAVAALAGNTSSTFRCSTATTGASFQDITTSTKRLRFITSGSSASTNNAISVVSTASRTYTLGDVTAGIPLLGIAASASGTLGRIVLTGQNGSLTAQTLLTGTTVSAGLYRVSFYLKTTTGGDAADNVTVTLAWNEGTAQTEVIGFLGSTSNIAPYTAHDLFVNNSFSHASVVVRVAASQNITFTTTLTSPGAGTPVYTIDARLEYLG